jgi:ABC-type multidrug transport system fused ATPase/permease subunit
VSTLKSCDLVLVLEQGRLVEVKQCSPEAWAQAAN